MEVEDQKWIRKRGWTESGHVQSVGSYVPFPELLLAPLFKGDFASHWQMLK